MTIPMQSVTTGAKYDIGQTAGHGNVAATHINEMRALASDPGIVANLTPEGLMFYCQSRLRGLDDQIQSAMAGQKKANADCTALTKLHEVLNRDAKDTDVGTSTMQEMSDAYDEAIAAVGADSAAGTQLALDKAKILNPTNDTKLSDVECKAMINSIESLTKNINSGSELQMINLQSLMSQRQSAVQLTTNLVQALGDQANKIAANIGH